MIDNDFCELLEQAVSKVLANSKDERTKGFWCDGILLPSFESEYSKKFVNEQGLSILQ